MALATGMSSTERDSMEAASHGQICKKDWTANGMFWRIREHACFRASFPQPRERGSRKQSRVLFAKASLRAQLLPRSILLVVRGLGIESQTTHSRYRTLSILDLRRAALKQATENQYRSVHSALRSLRTRVFYVVRRQYRWSEREICPARLTTKSLISL